jgi:hypothetical protein
MINLKTNQGLEPPSPVPAEAVSRCGAFIRRGGTGEGSFAQPRMLWRSSFSAASVGRLSLQLMRPLLTTCLEISC